MNKDVSKNPGYACSECNGMHACFLSGMPSSRIPLDQAEIAYLCLGQI